MNKKIAIIGCGNLGLSILRGLLEEKNIKPDSITATKRNTESIIKYSEAGVKITSNNIEAVKNSELVILALKPYNILNIIKEIKPVLNEKHIIVSLASGITISQIKEIIPEQKAIFRAMPNTAADVKESLTCIATENANPEDIETVKSFFNILGNSVVIGEELMAAATVLGACGIAYVMRFMRAMVQGGIQIGFDSKTASTIVNQTVLGAAQLLIERKNHPEFEIDKVTTPRGCTIVGLNEMEHNGFSSSLIKGIVSSYKEIG